MKRKALIWTVVIVWWASGVSGWLYWVSCVADVGIGGLGLAAIGGISGPIQWPLGYYVFGPGKLPNILIIHKRNCCKAK